MERMGPREIEAESMAIIARELADRGIKTHEEEGPVLRRVIHATADFDFAHTLRFTPSAVERGREALRGGVIVTDTNMALAGINKSALTRLDCRAVCFMGEEFIAQEAQRRGVTRARASMDYAVQEFPQGVYAVGNAPTALLRLSEWIEGGGRPGLVIGVPVGFVNVVESKEKAWDVCQRHGVPAIIALGRKGGSGVAAAVCNALLYGTV